MDTATFTAVGFTLPTLGGGIAWVWSELKAAKAKTEARFVAIEDKLDECRDREDAAKARASGLLTVIELLCQEVRRLLTLSGQTESTALKRAKDLMDGMKFEFPLDDPDMAAMARELDRRGQA